MLKVRNLSKAGMLKTIFSASLLLCSTAAMAQIQKSGVIKDANGEPLVGVTVLEQGTQNGTVTDVNGRYTLKTTKANAKLKVSYIGYETQYITPGQSITLQADDETLNEVVVVGYGTMRRKDVTSSITTVSAKDLDQGVYTDPAQMLQGKVAGLVITSTGDPNGTPSITLRGASSLRTGDAMQPYYVIDGIPGVDISLVAPDDIESIDVLRDASATAIYGSKAANGVIIITTKSGMKGANRTNVTYSGYVAFDDILKTLDMATADDLRQYAEKNNKEIADGGANTDWQDEVLRTAVSHNHNLSINGGSGNTTYMASLNYINREGIIKSTSHERINLRTLVSTKVLKDRLGLSAGVNVVSGKRIGVASAKDGDSVMDAMNYFSPTNPVYNEDGSYSVGKGSRNYNPVALINENPSQTEFKRMQIIGKATLDIVKGLKWNANFSYVDHQRTYSAYNTHLTQLEGVSSKNGRATRSTYFGKETSFETYGNYNLTLNKIHKLDFMAGYSWEERNNGDGFGLTVHDFYDDTLTWYNLTYASTIDGIPAIESGTKQTIRNISFYGRASYSFNSKYMLQATVRRDGSSVFGKDNRWGTFPSVSAAWNITEENFMKSQNIFDQLKLRVGYGVSGNSMGFDAYTAVATYGATGFFDYNGQSWRTLGATKNANPDLKWEKTSMLNVGVDFAILDGRINGTLEVYNKVTDDLIWSYPVSTNLYPFGYIDANVGKITNRGIELTLNATPIKRNGFTWQTTLNLAHNKNKVNRLSNDIYKVDRFTQGDPNVAGVSSEGFTQRIIEGEPLGTFYTFQFAGYNESGKAVYYTRDENGNLDGNTTTAPEYKDRTITGCAQPDLNLGWNNTLTYKKFSLNMFFTGVFGNDVYNSARANYTSPQMFSDGKNVLKEFIYERPVTDDSPNSPSDRFIEDGSYLRLKTLTLGYTFDKFNGWLKQLQVYFTCNNVFTITGYDGIDPEVNMGGIDPGIDYRWSNYPHSRTFLLGAKISF